MSDFEAKMGKIKPKEVIQAIIQGMAIVLMIITIFTVGNWNTHYIQDNIKDFCGSLYPNIDVKTDITGTMVGISYKTHGYDLNLTGNVSG